METWTPEELKKVLDKSPAVFVKLWKKGCGACKLSKPALERIEAKHGASVVFGEISTDDHPEMLEIADTEVLPTFFAFKNQKLVDKFIGFKGLAKLQEFVEKNLT